MALCLTSCLQSVDTSNVNLAWDDVTDDVYLFANSPSTWKKLPLGNQTKNVSSYILACNTTQLHYLVVVEVCDPADSS